MKKNKVFVGPGNIAGNAMSVAKALRLVGIDATSYSYNVHPFGYDCDYDNILFKNPFINKKRNIFQKLVFNKHILKIIWATQKLLLFARAILNYNTFIFISHDTFFNNNKDLSLLKFFKKKIYFIFLGCMERDPKNIINTTDRGFCSFCKDIGMQNYLNCYNGNEKQKKINYISEKSDFIFAQRDTTSFILDKIKIKPFYCVTDQKIDKEEIIKKFSENNELLITHLPSNNLLKGTSYVDEAIKQIKKNGSKFQYYSNRIKHSEVNFILKKTNILIDQFASGHGLLAVEGMSNGCVVICRTAKWFNKDFPELPLISCEPEELTDVLMNLITNREKMINIALKSLEYYQKFHTPEVVGNYYKNFLKLN